MSQTVITTAFEALKAQQAAANTPVVLDEFVFANVSNLNITDPIDPAEALPAIAQIVHRAAVAKTGVVNENAVVYSVTLGADVGDFEFNWVGLINKSSNTLAMIVHAPVQSKVKNAAGKQGNVLTRSFLMEYDGAKKETQITTPAATWQIDFTARLAGMDERQRIANLDIYGTGAFIGDGFLVKRSGNNYTASAGAGYVGGLRAVLAADQSLTVSTKPVKVWVDTSFTGTLTSVWQVNTVVTVADTLADYVKNDVNHYVYAVAQINADGSVTDLRPKGSKGEQQANNDFLRKDKNLSDVEDAAQVRQHIGLGTAATQNVQTSKIDKTDGRLLQVGAFGLGVSDSIGFSAGITQADALKQLRDTYGSGFWRAASSGPVGIGSYNPSVFIRAGDTMANLSIQYGSGIVDVLSSNDSDANKGVIHYNRLYGTANKPTAGDVGALPLTGGTLDGDLRVNGAINIGDTDTGFLTNGDGSAFIRANNVNIGWWDSSKLALNKLLQAGGGIQTPSIELSGGAAVIDFHQSGDSDDYNVRVYNDGDNKLSLFSRNGNPILNNNGKYIGAGAAGAWSAEYGNQNYAPYNTTYINGQNGDAWCPIITGSAGKNNGFPTYTTFGYYIPPGNSFNHPTICATGDNGAFARWMFNFGTGDITFSNRSLGKLVAFQDWVTALFGTQAWVNQVNANTQNWVRANFVADVALGAQGSMIVNNPVTVPSGCTMTGWYTEGQNPGGDTIYYRPVQKSINGTWYTVGHTG